MDGSPPAGATRRLPVFALLSASAVSEFGNVLTFVAVPWFVLETTGSAARTGLTGGAVTLAVVVAGFFGGPIVDRLGFKRASVVADLASGATVAAIPLLYHTVGLAFWQLLALVFLGAFLDAPGLTARQSIVPDLAGLSGVRAERVNSAMQAIGQFSLLLGPPAAGVLIAALTPSNVLFLDAATFAVSAAAIASLVPSSARRTDRSAEGGRGARQYLAELAEGFRFVRRDRVNYSTIPISVGLNFLIVPVLSVALPVLARRAYGSAVDLGLMLGGYGGGALAGAILYGAAGHRLPRRATFVTLLFAQALPLWTLAAAPPPALAVGALAITGLGVGPVNPLIYTVRQERTPREMLGRVHGATGALAMAAAPLGTVAVGYALEVAGLRPTLIGIAACYLAVALYALLNPALREMDVPASAPTERCPAAPERTTERRPAPAREPEGGTEQERRGAPAVRDLRKLPKAHLHLHLEGSARASTVRELAEREGVRLPALTKRRFEGFADFGAALSAATSVLRTLEDIARVCKELVEDEAEDGVVYTEPMVSPHLHAGRFGISPEEVFLAMREAFEGASAATGVRVGLMVGIDRSRSTEEAEEAARFAAAHADDGVVSLGLAGPGRAGHEEHARFAHACDIARAAGLAIVPHAGLLEGAASVREALKALSPARIAHGVRAAEDPALLSELASRRVPCDACPSAEVGLGVFAEASCLPLKSMLAVGVPITLGADDPLLFGSSVGEEYALCRRSLGLSDEELALVARSGIEAAALPGESKRRHAEAIDCWLRA